MKFSQERNENKYFKLMKGYHYNDKPFLLSNNAFLQYSFHESNTFLQNNKHNNYIIV